MGLFARRRRKVTASTRELGLDLALIAARYLFQTDHLHYGLWLENLPVEAGNLKLAQEHYTDLIASAIPAGVRTILDVGSGTGALARRLQRDGYEVSCVSPSPYLTERTRSNVEADTTIFECRYEEFHTDKKYDLVLFSESFQYINLEKALAVTNKHLRTGGYFLICDFFRNETVERGPFGGGHRFQAFQEEVARYPFCNLLDRDITAQTAPNIDLVADFTTKVVFPIQERLWSFFGNSYPIPYRAVRWLFRRPLAHAETKYLTGQRTGSNFAKYKTYRLMVFQNQTEPVLPVGA